jgi:ribosomal protein S18 acetylase RimI-like enzyme
MSMSTETTDRLRVRPAQAEDHATIVDYNLRLARESEGLALDPAVVSAGVRAVLADAAKGAYFVAEVGGRVVGQVMVTVEWSDWRNGPIWWLQSVYVETAHRDRGVFRALYEEVVAAARRIGARALRLYVEEGNQGAQEVYRRLGMRRSGYLVFELGSE